MITLNKTAKPLHTMTDSELRAAIVNWERREEQARGFPVIANRFAVITDVFLGEQLRRVQAFLRS